MAEIALDGVSKTFPDGTVAVRRADFTIGNGEFFVLVGPSGCGKSTLLNMIVGLEDVSEGTIRVDGEIINHMDPKDRNMAMVFQSYALYPHMSVRENMAFPLKLAKKPREEISRRVERAAQTLQLSELLDRKPSGLSGGQKQRVAMGRAIVREPRAFLLDEPLSNLDARLRVQMRTEMARLHKRLGATTVYVTHDQTEAMTLGERIAVLREGVVQQIGTPRELYDEPGNLFVAGFIGSPSMNLLPARLGGGRVRLPMVELALPDLWRHRLGERTGRVIAGMRPEHIEDASSSDGDGPTFQAKVEVREWMGHELDVYFPVSGSGDPLDDSIVRHREKDTETIDRQMCARLSADSQAAPGRVLELRIRPEKLQLFDAETGSSLLHVST